MFRLFSVAAVLLFAVAPLRAQPAEDSAFLVPTGEVLLHRTQNGAVVGALPGAAGRLLQDGLELTAGTAVVSWSGTFSFNGSPLPCDETRCQQTLGVQATDAVAILHRALLVQRDLPLNLAQLEQELNKEEAAFTETGVVSVEAGSVCLDSTGADSGGVSGMENPQTQVEKTPATLRVKVTFE